MFNHRVYMCSPSYYGIKYSINPWMDIKNSADSKRAYYQWENLHHTIIRLGGYVEYCNQLANAPDMVFTANAALIYKGKAVIANFKYPQRKVEEKEYYFDLQEKLSDTNVFILSNDYYFEGAGDALFAGDTLFAGYGFRTDKIAYEQIGALLNINNIVYCELVSPYFYHLDTCFCPLNNQDAIYFPEAFSQKTKDLLSSRLNMFPVPEEEAKRFSCNAVVLDQNVIMPSDCPKTKSILEYLGFNVYPIDMSEFIKAGGACKCLTLKL